MNTSSMPAEAVANIATEVRRRMEGEGSGHDWWHIYRVWKMAQRIGKEEGADMLTVELAALLHDIADWKFNGGDETEGPRIAKEMCIAQGVPEHVADHVAEIVMTSGWKGGKGPEMRTIEGRVMQDADRLEAIGAIGIARAFAYGGHKNRPLHDPEQKPATFDEGGVSEARGRHNQPFLRKTAPPQGPHEHQDREGDRRRTTSLHGRIPRPLLQGMGRETISLWPTT